MSYILFRNLNWEAKIKKEKTMKAIHTIAGTEDSMERKKTLRVEHIDLLRAVGIIFMIMGHLSIGGAKMDHIIHSFHMPLFFIISGYFYKKGDWKRQTIHKAKTILIPYLVFGLFHYAFWILLNYSKTDNLLRPLQCLLYDCTSLDMPIAGALWFLPCLFFSEVIFILIDRLGGGADYLLVGAISILGNYWTSIFDFRLPLALDTAFVGLGLFCIGHLLRKIEIIKKLDRIGLFWTVLMTGVNIVLVMKNGYVNMRIGTYGCIPLFWINAVLSTLILWKYSKLVWSMLSSSIYGKGMCNYFCRVGKNSMIYLAFNQLAIFIATLIIIIVGWRNFAFFTRIEKYVLLLFTMIIIYVIELVITKTKLGIILGKKEINVK